MSPNILIVRLSAIGDCIETLPLVATIKNHLPQSKITWVVDCGVDAILRTQPGIEKVIRVKKGVLKRPRELFALSRELRKGRFDFAIDPQGLLKSGVICWLSGAKHRIGFASPQAREKAWWLYHDRIQPTNLHLVDRQLELLTPLSLPLPASHRATFNWFEPPDVGHQADAIVKEMGLQSKAFISLNPCAGWPSRVWPLQRYAEIIDAASVIHKIKFVVIWGSSAERESAAWIVSNSKSQNAILAPPTPLMLLSGLLKRSLAYLGSDTGPMHLSAAVGTDCLALFGPTLASYSGPYGLNHICIQKIDDSKSKNKRSESSAAAMEAISVDDVLKSIQELLSK